MYDEEYGFKEECRIRIIVLGMVERGGKVICIIVPDKTKETLIPTIEKNVKEGSKIMTDKLTSYFSLYENYNHYTITHRKSYVRGRGGQIHTNTIEGLWSLFKRGILGSYHFTTEEHLQKYLNEFCFRYNTKNYSKKERFDYFLKNIENK